MCVKLTSDPKHCGACDAPCDSDEKCSNERCVPLQPCEGAQDPCDSHGSCAVVDEFPSCGCDSGYEHPSETSDQCVDVDECALATDGCDAMATCVDSDGTFSCECPPGYDNDVSDPLSCVDVDECALGIANCDPLATCLDTDGDFTCTCPAGYAGDGTSCVCGDSANFAMFCNGTTIAADTTYSGYSANNVIDGDTTTAQLSNESWTNAWPVSFPQNVTIDFGASRTLGRIELYTSDMYEILHYAIDYWDGAGWVQLVEITNNVVIHRTHTFAQVSSPKIRVRTYSGPTGQTIYARLNEVQVFAN